MYLEMFKLSGRTALVTGGGRAIGLSCVEALAEAGRPVVALAQSVKASREVLREEAGFARTLPPAEHQSTDRMGDGQQPAY